MVDTDYGERLAVLETRMGALEERSNTIVSKLEKLTDTLSSISSNSIVELNSKFLLLTQGVNNLTERLSDINDSVNKRAYREKVDVLEAHGDKLIVDVSLVREELAVLKDQQGTLKKIIFGAITGLVLLFIKGVWTYITGLPV